ncbi:MAG: sulfatase-like hydrolase/transferase, partial [Verrucomicrobia bacterium]|nr:sulfatase-like hydrolase/transferase [Verrucomicrobiota bacterium]
MRTTAAVVAATVLLLAQAGRAATGRPNILHLHADDHRPDGLGALGNPVLKTPNLDALVARGMTFTHCYTMGSMVGAVCTPSRTMLLTGRSWQRIPGAPGAAPDAGNPATFLPRVIAAAGYETWHMGKGGNAFKPGLQEFGTCILDDGKDEGPAADRAHASRRLADAAVRFLESRDASKPFYMYLAPPVPHDPRSAEPQFHAMYDPAKIPLSPAFLPQHPWDNGEMTVRDEKLAPWPRTPADTCRQLAEYYACISGLDHHAGRILEALKKTGQWENTIVVFSGDNGLSLGEHGLFGKQNLYEFGGMHVPLVVAGPGIPRGRTDALVYLMDLFPTFCDFAGAKAPAGIDGRSLRPMIEGKAPAVRDALYTGYMRGQRAVRDDRWKLIRYPLVDRTQLFDLQADPHELTNLASRAEFAVTLQRMTALLEREMRAYDDGAPLKVDAPAPADWTPPPPGADEPAARAGRAPRFGAAAAGAAEVSRPNILFVIFDDWGWPHAGAYGCSWVKTPNFDRVAREGVLFRNAFTSNPKCSPCRASILTGRNSWQLEEAVCHFGIFPSKFAVYPDLMERAGHAVGLTGKGWGPGDWKSTGFPRNPAGPEFQRRRLVPPASGIATCDYVANFEDFLGTRKPGQPFCFWMGFTEPHRGYELDSGIRAGKKPADVTVPASRRAGWGDVVFTLTSSRADRTEDDRDPVARSAP